MIVLKGKISVGSNDLPLDAFHTLVLSSDTSQTGVQISALEDGTELVLVSYLPQYLIPYPNFRFTDRWRAS